MTERFGIRTISFDVKEGFKLNGRRMLLNSSCMHHDNGPLGAAAYDDAEYRRVRLTKAAGFNAIRSAHNPPSEALLKACDELGVLVTDEAFDCWKGGKTAPITLVTSTNGGAATWTRCCSATVTTSPSSCGA